LTVSYTLCAHVEGPEKVWGTLGPRPLGWRHGSSAKNTLLLTRYLDECGRSTFKKTSPFLNNSVKHQPHQPILIRFGMQHSEETCYF